MTDVAKVRMALMSRLILRSVFSGHERSASPGRMQWWRASHTAVACWWCWTGLLVDSGQHDLSIGNEGRPPLHDEILLAAQYRSVVVGRLMELSISIRRVLCRCAAEVLT